MLVESPTYDRPLKILAARGVEIDGGADGRRRPRSRRARASPRRPGRNRRSCTRSRPSRTRAAALSPPSAAAGSSSSRASGTCSSSRTIRTGSSASKAKRRRRCSSSTAASTSRIRRPSRRRSRRACASATSSSRARSRPSWRRSPSRPTSRRCCSGRRPCTSSCGADSSNRTSTACARCSAPGGTRCSRRSSSELASAHWSRPDGGYFVWLELAENVDAAELLERAAAAGVTFVKGTDFGGGPEHRAACVQLRIARRDPRRRAAARGARRGAGRGLAGCRCLDEVAERPRNEARLPRRNERAAAVQAERRTGSVRREGAKPGATEIAVVARHLWSACSSCRLPTWGGRSGKAGYYEGSARRQELSRMKTTHFPAVSTGPKSAR